MTTYECTLVKNGYVKEHFYRQGESYSDIENDLNSFMWGKGGGMEN